MIRGTLVLLVAFALVTGTPAASAAQEYKAGKVPRIGILHARGPDLLLDGLIPQRLRELGYMEGQSIIIEQRYAEGSAERLSQLAAELVRLKVDVIAAVATPAAQAAKSATKTIPIELYGRYGNLWQDSGTAQGGCSRRPPRRGPREPDQSIYMRQRCKR